MSKPKTPKRLKKGKHREVLSSSHKPDHLTMTQWQLGLRSQAAQMQKLRVRNTGKHPAYSDFLVFNPQTKREYRVAIRGMAPGVNYCSCPDYAVNTLGTCKHIEVTLLRLKKDSVARAALRLPYRAQYSEIFLQYGAKREVVFSKGAKSVDKFISYARRFFNHENILTESGVLKFDQLIKKAKEFDPNVRFYDDAMQFIAEWRDSLHRAQIIDREFAKAIKTDGGADVSFPFIKTPLYRYQAQGAIFAARAGRCIIADEMGLGKTIQAIAAIEIMAAYFEVEKVLVVCPTSLKFQWKMEIEKFCGRDSVIVEGQSPKRRASYESKAFYTIANYEQVYRDLEWINARQWDVVILDETQRIKNWKALTSQAVKSLRSQYAIALTGTPLENRIEELHSIVSFIDRFKLGPLFRFLENHQVVDPQTGKVTGYRNLSDIGRSLSTVLIRRTKKQVLSQLPGRLDKNYFVPMTPEQMAVHQDNANVVAQIVARWKKFKHLSESDQRKLMMALQNMRMSCDSTYLVDKREHFGPKLDELITFLGELLVSEGEKTVIFSQWRRMHELIEEVLKKNGIGYVILHGAIPAKNRGELVAAFRNDPAIRVFLSTDAGGTGLNLQNASTVINIDLPWNPAVLEQRIGRVHRLGQHRPVRVINFISEGTIEHGMLNILAFKRSLFAGVLDGGDDAVFMGESRFNKFMKDVETVAGGIPAVVEPSERSEPLSAVEPPSPEALELPKEEYGEAGESRPPVRQASGGGAAAQMQLDSLQKLFQQGSLLLQGLSQALFSSGERKDPVAPFLEKDPTSGKQYLKLPFPEPETLSRIISQVSALLSGPGIGK